MVKAGEQVRTRKTTHTVVCEFPFIIRVESEEGQFIEEEDVHALRKANLDLSGGGPYSVLLDTSKGYAAATPEANKLMAAKEFSRHRKAIAIIARSMAAKLVSNFFIRFNKPHTPTRVFMHEEDAIAWLKEKAK